jgi:manganese/iron transport system ATP-binding protein
MNINSPAIRLENVSVTYPNGHAAIEDVSFELNAGMICGLVGVNGAGKSTLFKSMMGFIRPTTGKISIMGRPVREALRENIIAYVPQTEDVDWNFPVLVEDVVMMGRYGRMGFFRIPSAADKNAVDAALERVGMQAYRKRQIGELSGGQKKRVFVARALAQGGKIIFLDEPFTGIDVKTENTLIELFRGLAEEGTLILVSTHNLGSVPSFCDEVILINRQLVAAGPIEDVFTQDNLAKAFGGMLRHVHVGGGDLHHDSDQRRVTVLTDDERPVVLYGEEGGQKIFQPGKKQHD